ncbi:hypothetical protein [uncultured Psychroserpens sp.]|uniref:hypothetical protein n=1 Tax=uncultured Psychroserpens sp. TaxID=255436 RepID=UPI00262F2182|nr:hypothetical protein [uncultured Psychroserpens sp.]
MKTLKITFLLLAVLVLTVSGVRPENANLTDEQPTQKEYTPKDQLALEKKKLKLKSQV